MSENQKQTVFGEPEQKWIVPQSLTLIGISLLVLGAVILLVRMGLLQRLFAHVLILIIPAAAFWIAAKLYATLADKQPRSSYASRARNWGPLIASILIGIAVLLATLSMFSHQTARTLDSITLSDGDDD